MPNAPLSRCLPLAPFSLTCLDVTYSSAPQHPSPIHLPFPLALFPASTAQVKSPALPGAAPHSLPRLSPPPCAPPPAPGPLPPSRLLPSLSGLAARPFSLACAPSRSASLPSVPAQTAGGGTVAAALQVQPPTLEDRGGPGRSRSSPAPAAPPRTLRRQAPRAAGSRRRLPRASLLLPLSEILAGFLLRLQGALRTRNENTLSCVKTQPWRAGQVRGSARCVPLSAPLECQGRRKFC